MKRKLVCLLLAFATVFSCFAFAGCSKGAGDKTVDGTTTDTASLTTVTLTLWLPTDEDTTEEAILAVQEAINKITKSRFETAIELHAIPRDEYAAAIDARITEIEDHIAFEEEEAKRKREEAKSLAAQGITTAPETTAPETTAPEGEDTYVNDIGMQILKYPEVGEYQMDIFLVQGYDNYESYIDREALAELDEELIGDAKILRQYIYPTFLSNVKYDGVTYAIPNNHAVGEFQYLLINKRLVDELYWNPADLKNLMRCKDFILDVKERTDVVPFLAPDDLNDLLFWPDNGSFSLISSQLPSTHNLLTYAPPRSTLSTKAYTDLVYFMKVMEENNCVVTDPASVEEFGVAILTGDPSIEAEYGDNYYVSVHQTPSFSKEDVYGNMFAVSSYTKDVNRSMEIITALNTDPELRTILQYGVEDKHWKVNDENPDVIDVISDDYKMNILETGNVYMTYPAAGVSKDVWEYSKTQNLASQVSPYYGFDIANYDTTVIDEYLVQLEQYSKEIYDRIEAMSAQEFSDGLSALRKEVNANEVILRLLSQEDAVSLYSFYFDFFTDNGGSLED